VNSRNSGKIHFLELHSCSFIQCSLKQTAEWDTAWAREM